MIRVTKHAIELDNHGLDFDHVINGSKDVVDGNVSVVVAKKIDNGGDGIKSDEIRIELGVANKDRSISSQSSNLGSVNFSSVNFSW